jgi:hypothetical protein
MYYQVIASAHCDVFQHEWLQKSQMIAHTILRHVTQERYICTTEINLSPVYIYCNLLDQAHYTYLLSYDALPGPEVPVSVWHYTYLLSYELLPWARSPSIYTTLHIPAVVRHVTLGQKSQYLYDTIHTCCHMRCYPGPEVSVSIRHNTYLLSYNVLPWARRVTLGQKSQYLYDTIDTCCRTTCDPLPEVSVSVSHYTYLLSYEVLPWARSPASSLSICVKLLAVVGLTLAIREPSSLDVCMIKLLLDTKLPCLKIAQPLCTDMPHIYMYKQTENIPTSVYRHTSHLHV